MECQVGRQYMLQNRRKVKLQLKERNLMLAIAVPLSGPVINEILPLTETFLLYRSIILHDREATDISTNLNTSISTKMGLKKLSPNRSTKTASDKFSQLRSHI